MKKLIVCLFCMFIVSPLFSKEDLNEDQLNLRNSIENFLKEEGYMPKITSSSKIKFKSEGETYYVNVNEYDESPMYVSLSKQYAYDENFTKEKIEKLMPELNLYKGVKLICFSETYSLQGELYLVNADSFKYIFYKLMSQINQMRDELVETID